MIKRIIFTFTIVVLFNSFILAQEEPLLAELFIKTGNGYLFVNNNADKSFSLEITGKDVKPAEGVQVPMFIVNGYPIQILSVDVKSFAPNNNGPGDLELLEKHRDWETNYLGKDIYQKKLKVFSSELKYGKRKALLWGFNRPSSNEQFQKDYFMTTIIGKTLLAIGIAPKTEDKESDVRKMAGTIMKTLEIQDKPFDIKKLSDSYRNSKK
jgi:hypothetical protein